MGTVVGTGTENVGTWRILKGEPEGTWRKGRTKERWMNGVTRRMTNRGQTEDHRIEGNLLGAEETRKEPQT